MILLLAALLAQDVVAQECRPRDGLPHFFAKAGQKGAELKVAYFGGSITAQAGWRPKTLAHFQKTWPDAKFSEINAAIGGTGSDLGVFRLAQDVLDKKPDLLFVEFAVNDGGAAPDQIRRCMEGIVRQTRRALPDCDIAFVYTVTEALVGPLLEGRFPRTAAVMEEVADRYGIPSIHMAMEVARLAKEKKLAWKAPLGKGDILPFANDGVHPYPETGHELYLAAVVRSLEPIRAASKPRGALPEPLIASNYERARLIPITEATLSAGFEAVEDKRWAGRLPTLRKASKAGESLAFKFKGTRCAIYDLLGPDLGQVVVTLDGGPPKTVSRFDGYSTYHRLGTLLVGTELADVEHTVKIEIHPEAPDKAAILGKRGEKMDKPERFQGTCFYPGAILLVGELITGSPAEEPIAVTRVVLKQYALASELFKLDHDRYPMKLSELVEKPSDIDAKRWPPGGYLKRIMKDGWGREILYRVPGPGKRPFELVSLGSDGAEGGHGDAADLKDHDGTKEK